MADRSAESYSGMKTFTTDIGVVGRLTGCAHWAVPAAFVIRTVAWYIGNRWSSPCHLRWQPIGIV